MANKTHIFLWVLVVGFILTIPPISKAAQTPILTTAQDAWLSKEQRTIHVNPEKTNSPYVFLGSGTVKNIKGLSVEYIEAIAELLNAKVVYNEPTSLSEIIKSTKDGDNGVLLSLSPNEDLDKLFYFTDSYISMPAVIVTRKDYNPRKVTISLNEFSNKKVAVGDQYPVEAYISFNYPKVIISPAKDDEAALQRLLLGEVDAVVMDLASLSYYTSNDVLSYVKAVGRTGFEYKHSFAVPKSKPELLLILDAGLKNLSDAQKQVIIDKWIDISTANINSSSAIPSKPNSLYVWLAFSGFIVLIIATVITVITLRKTQIKMIFKGNNRKGKMGEVQSELHELKKVHETLREEMETITALEEDIEKKINSTEGAE